MQRERYAVELQISRHADRRCRERVGVPRRAVHRTVERAWALGALLVGAEFRGRRGGGERVICKQYGGHRYVFTRKDCGVVVCVTVLPIRTAEERGDVAALEWRRQRRSALRRRRRRKYSTETMDVEIAS